MSIRAGKWLVTKYDGARKVWQRELPARKFTPIQIQDVLLKLACTDLTAEEVMDSIDPAMTTNHLFFRSENIGSYSCGENPHYTAKHVR